MNSRADFFFKVASPWKEAYALQRDVALHGGLGEELKWGCPTYTFEKKNIVLIHSSKNYCACLFFKGALMNAPEKILIQQTKNVQAARQVRFTSAKDITKRKATLKTYRYKTVNLEAHGATANVQKSAEVDVPHEFTTALDDAPKLKKAFQALTPAGTRLSAVVRVRQTSENAGGAGGEISARILDAKGLDDE